MGGLLFLGAVQAQSDRGTITGTVMDQAGAVVPMPPSLSQTRTPE